MNEMKHISIYKVPFNIKYYLTILHFIFGAVNTKGFRREG